MFTALLTILICGEFLVISCVCDRISEREAKRRDYNGLYIDTHSLTTEDYYEDNIPEIFATTEDFVRKYGYPVETHTVTTEDGYLLTVHRIPGSPRAAASAVKTPVLLMHGLLATSDIFVLMGSDKSLGFLLADQGYDVWMGNARGNFYSRKHVTLSPKDPKFWNFSWHEMGVYDLPAVIDHILKTSNHQQLFYVGHSMGTTMFFVLTSMKPEYNAKIRLGVNMAPAVFLNTSRSRVVKLLSRNTQIIQRSLATTGLYELAPRVKSIQTLLGQVCNKGSPLLEICIFATSAIFGIHRETLNLEKYDVIFSHMAAGSSVNAFLHFAEIMAADRFQVFDPTVTLGKFTPEYNLSQVSAPVYLLYAENDKLVSPDSVMRLKRHLHNVVRLHRLPDNLAGHIDFVFAKNSKQLVYNEMINEMNRFK